MTETEWWACQDAQSMLALVQASGRASDRKLRLFAVACCRSVWPLLRDEASRKAVEVAERFAEGMASEEDLSAAGDAAGDAPWDAVRAGDAYGECVAHAASWATAGDAATAAEVAARFARGCDQDSRRPDGSSIATMPEEERRQAALLRDIFGSLAFRPPPAVAASVLEWNDGCVVKLARAVYEERDFSEGRMNILADALEEAGCTVAELLGHLRGPGPHVRGCWAVDLILAKDR
jgi:hypothetical protein